MPLACAQGMQDGDDVGAGESGSPGAAGALRAGSGNAAGRAGSGVSGGGSSTGGSAGKGSGGAGSGAGGKVGNAGAAGAAGKPGGGGSSSGGSSGMGMGAGGAAAGSSSVGGAAGAPAATGFTIQYKNNATAGSGAYIAAEILAKNDSQSTVAVNSLKVRYFFSDEPKKPITMAIYYAYVKQTGNQLNVSATYEVKPMAQATGSADTYLEFSFSSGDHPMLAPGEGLQFAWQLQGPDPSKDVFTQTNDFSWDAGKTSLSSWDHVQLLQGSTVVWGASP